MALTSLRRAVETTSLKLQGIVLALCCHHRLSFAWFEPHVSAHSPTVGARSTAIATWTSCNRPDYPTRCGVGCLWLVVMHLIPLGELSGLYSSHRILRLGHLWLSWGCPKKQQSC